MESPCSTSRYRLSLIYLQAAAARAGRSGCKSYNSSLAPVRHLAFDRPWILTIPRPLRIRSASVYQLSTKSGNCWLNCWRFDKFPRLVFSGSWILSVKKDNTNIESLRHYSDGLTSYFHNCTCLNQILRERKRICAVRSSVETELDVDEAWSRLGLRQAHLRVIATLSRLATRWVERNRTRAPVCWLAGGRLWLIWWRLMMAHDERVQPETQTSSVAGWLAAGARHSLRNDRRFVCAQALLFSHPPRIRAAPSEFFCVHR